MKSLQLEGSKAYNGNWSYDGKWIILHTSALDDDKVLLLSKDLSILSSIHVYGEAIRSTSLHAEKNLIVVASTVNRRRYKKDIAPEISQSVVLYNYLEKTENILWEDLCDAPHTVDFDAIGQKIVIG